MAQETLLIEVAAGNISGVKKALRKGANVNFIFDSGDFALKLAASDEKYFQVAKLLIEKGANVDLVNSHGVSALMEACKNGCRELVCLLLSKGAQVDLKDNQQQTALMYSCESLEPKSLEVARELLKHKANIDLSVLQDGEGRSALMIACANNNRLAVDLLLHHGRAQVNLRDKKEQSALMIACKTGQTKIIKTLLNSGANVHAEDNEGKTALTRACEAEIPGIVELLLIEGALYS